MKNYVVVINPDHTVTFDTVRDGPDLQMLQKSVGGYIEAVPHFSTVSALDLLSLPHVAAFPQMQEEMGNTWKCVALCNEDGKAMGLPVNELATMLWASSLRRQAPGTKLNDVLVGSVVLLFGSPEWMSKL